MKRDIIRYSIVSICLAVLQVIPLSVFAQIPTEGLLLHYPLNGDVQDFSENGNHATPIGSLNPIPDRLGNTPGAYSFDGVDDYIAGEDHIVSGFPVTISAWVKGEEVWINTNGHPEVYFGAILVFRPTEVILRTGSSECFCPDGRKDYNSKYNFDPEKWYHVVGVFNAFEDRKIYINGNEVIGSYDIESGANSFSFTEGIIQINKGPVDRFYKGSVDEVRIYTRSLDSVEVMALYSEGGTSPEAPTNLQANSVSNQEIRLTWQDNSYNENNFILQRSIGNNNSFQDLTTLPEGTTTYQDTTVTSNTQYFYQIYAYNAINGNSQLSNIASDTTFKDIDLEQGLVAYYPMNGDAVDASGNENDGTTNRTTATDDRQGNHENALFFNGNANVRVPDNETLDFTSAYSIAMWCNTSNLSPGFQTLITKGGEPIESYALFIRSDGRIHAVHRINDEREHWDSETTIQADTWHHIVITYDGYFAKVYIDGEMAGTKELVGSITPNNTLLEFGQRTGGTSFFGALDEVRLYNRTLNELEISALYDQGGFEQVDAGIIAFIIPDFSILNEGEHALELIIKNYGTSLLENATVRWKVNGMEQTPIAWQDSLNTQETDTVSLPIFDFTPGKTYQIEANVSDPNGQTDENSANDKTEISTLFVNSMEPHYALSFNGTEGDVIVQDQANLKPQQLTIEAWVNPTSYNAWSTIVSKTTRDQWDDGFGLSHYNGSDDIHFFVNQWNSYQVEGNIPFNQWSHVAGTYDGSQLKLYINGVLVDSLLYTDAIAHSSNSLLIGRAEGNSNYRWKGGIDEVRLWNVARSQEQIQEWMVKNAGLVNQPGLVATWHFGENQGNIAYDLTGNHPGQLINGVDWTPSKAPILDNRAPIDAGITSVFTVDPEFPSLKADIYAIIHNYGLQTLKSAQISWAVDQHLQTSYSWEGSLGSGQADTVLINSYEFSNSLNTPHTIEVWTSQPGGREDPITQNDSAKIEEIYTPLGGSYIVDDIDLNGSSQDSNADFVTLQDAINALAVRGMVAEVAFNILEGKYKNNFIIPAIPGSSCDKKVIFQSITQNYRDVVFDEDVGSGADNYMFQLENVDGIVLRYLTIIENTGTHNRVIRFKGNVNCVELSNCRLVGSSNDDSQSIRSIIVSDNTDNVSNLTVRNNLIEDGNYGIELKGISRNIRIENNRFTNQSSQSIALTSTDSCLIANNFIALPGSNAVSGLYLNNSGNIQAYYNTIIIGENSESELSGNVVTIQGGSGLQLINNNLVNRNGGFVIHAPSLAPPTLSDYNNLFTSGNALAFLSDTINSLSDWQNATGQDAHSLSADPLFATDSTYQVFQESLNNAGTPLQEVLTDIEGEPRDPSAPDIGADEFTLFPSDVGISAILHPQSGCELGEEDSVIVIVTNFGSQPQQDFPMLYQLDDRELITETFTNALLPGKRDTFTFATKIPIAEHKSYFLQVNTLLEEDQQVQNDSATQKFQNFGEPEKPINLKPSTNTQNLDLPLTLSWEPSDNATRYNLYVWKTGQDPPTNPTVANLEQIRYSLTDDKENLDYSQEYQWKIAASNAYCEQIMESDTQSFHLRALPDLVVAEIAPSQNNFYHETAAVSVTLKNQGEGDLPNLKFSATAFLSNDANFNSNTDRNVGSVVFDGPLPAGGNTAPKNITFTLPAWEPGITEDFYIFVVADLHRKVKEQTENNNINTAGELLAAQIPPHVDLQVPEVEVVNALPTPKTREDLIIKWRIINDSESELNSHALKHRIYLWSGETLDKQRAWFWDASYPVALAAGEDTVIQDSFTIPVDQFDSVFHIFVATDIDNKVPEYEEENNNLSDPSDPFEIELLLPPNLVVDSLAVDSLASPGETVNVTWEVLTKLNETFEDYWWDIVSISPSPDPTAPAIELGRFAHEGKLLLDTSYTRSEPVVLPTDLAAGTYYISVHTDGPDDVFEYTFEGDNISSVPLQITLPDLDAHALTYNLAGGGDSLQLGGKLTVEWKAINLGEGTLSPRRRTDRLTLTDSPDLNNDHPSIVASVNIAGIAMVADDTVSYAYTLDLPDTLTRETYYLVLQLDAQEVIGEIRDDNNFESVEIGLKSAPLPDLVIAGLNAEEEGQADSTILFAYGIGNEGLGEAKGREWLDEIFISQDTVFTNQARKLATIQHFESLPSDTFYTENTTLSLPADLEEGTYYLHLFTNRDGRLKEVPGGAQNNHAFVPIFIKSYPSVDISVQRFDILVEGNSSGEEVDVILEIINNGNGVTPFESWVDEIYISKDNMLDNRDQRVALMPHKGRLFPLQSYSLVESVTLPYDISTGVYFLILKTDAQGINPDSDPENNIQLASIGEDDDGNPIFEPIPIEVPPPADLVVQISSLPDEAVAGQPFIIIYEGKNQGEGPAKLGFVNRVLLSNNPQPDENDIVLDQTSINPVLEAGSIYLDTLEVILPLTDSGNFYLLLVTDNGDRIHEAEHEDNNVDYVSILIRQPPPSDLTVIAIETNTESVSIKDNIQVKWTTTNMGMELASGTMRESLYLSKDSVLNTKEDMLLGSKAKTIFLPPQSQTKDSVQVTIPAVSEGNYHILVATDVLNNIPDENRINNISAGDPVFVSIQTLEIDNPLAASIANRNYRYYKLVIDDSLIGKTLQVALESENNNAQNELYLRYSELPTQSIADQTHKDPTIPNQTLVVPALQAGIYYLLAIGNAAGQNNQNITLTATILPFGLQSVDSQEGGNARSVTVKLAGSQFTPDMQVWLEDARGNQIYAEIIDYKTPATVFPTFDLANQPLGVYHMMASKPDHDPVSLDSAFEIVPAFVGGKADRPDAGGSGGGNVGSGGFSCIIDGLEDFNEALEITYDFPEVVRPGDIFFFTIRYHNTGNVDMEIPQASFMSLSGAIIGFSIDEIIKALTGFNPNVQTIVDLFFDEAGGPAKILRPGAKDKVVIYSRAPAEPQLIRYRLRN